MTAGFGEYGETFMRYLIWVLAFALLFVPAFGGQPPQQGKGLDLAFAFPVPDKDFPPEDNSAVRKVAGSTRSYTQGQIDDLYNPPDWFPDEHAPMPRVVQHGSGTQVPGCASCHLASGSGHPESANLTGLSATYILRQITDFQSGLRTDPRHRMSEIAKGLSEDDAKQAAEWFASLKPNVWEKVVETDTVPETYVNDGHRRYIFFFFQEEAGIRHLTVTGVQTCALPIFERTLPTPSPWPWTTCPPSGSPARSAGS